MQVYTADAKHSVNSFCNSRNYQVLIIGYEMVSLFFAFLSSTNFHVNS